MKRSILKISLPILLILIFQGTSRSDEFESFREKYRAESQKIADSLKHIKGKYRITTRFNTTPKNKPTIDNGDFAVSGEYGKVVTDIERSFNGRNLNFVSVHCKTPDFYYSLSKNSSGSNYLVENKAFMVSSEKVPFISYDLNFGNLIKSPYKFMNVELIQILDGISIMDPVIENIEKDGKPIIRLSWHVKSSPMLRYEVEIDPAAHYRIHRLTHFAGEKRLIEFQIQYDTRDPLSTIPVKVVHQIDIRKSEFELFDIKLEPTPEAEFLPSFFGLPDFENNSRRSGVFSILFASIIILGFFIRFMIHRRSQRSLRIS